MRRAPLHPRQLLVIALGSFAMMFFVMLAQAPDLGSLDFSLHLDSGPAVSAQDAPAPPADPFVPQLDEVGPFARSGG
jgi:hypothetical protein